MSSFIQPDLFSSIAAALNPKIDFDFPEDAWEEVWIDGGCCKGHFSTERYKVNSIDGQSFEYRLRCFLNAPKCGCNCRIICGSKVKFQGDAGVWEVVKEEITRHPGCVKWELQESDCDDC